MITAIHKMHEKGKEPTLEEYLSYIVRGSETWNEIRQTIEDWEPSTEEEASRLEYLKSLMEPVRNTPTPKESRK
jgi:hypothetical protein